MKGYSSAKSSAFYCANMFLANEDVKTPKVGLIRRQSMSGSSRLHLHRKWCKSLSSGRSLTTWYILLLSIVTAIRKSQKQSNTSIKGCVMWVPPSVCHWVTYQCWICRCIGHNPDLGRDMSLCILHVKHLDSWLLQINDWELFSFTKRNVLLTCFSKLLKLLYRVRGSVKIHESPESLWAWFSYLWVLLFLEVEVNLPLVEREWFNLKCSITTCSLAERMGKSEGVFSITQNQHNSSSPDRRMAW